ncbi:MAG: peptidylprolyl isomerase [Bacteroidaceae bacterium]|nr:peptidylprolyl isomerase [Bacteroidaceae bacterium]
MMRKLNIVVLFIAFTLSLSAQSQLVDKVVWVVGGEPILLSDIEESRISSELQGIVMTNPYCEIPEQIAVQKLYLHQALLDSVEVSESRIRQEVDAMLEQYLQVYGTRENLELQAHKSYAQLREDFIQRRREQTMVQIVQQSLVKDIRVTPAEVRERFGQLPADSLPQIPEQLELQIITLEPQPSAEEIARVQDLLRDIAHRVNNGEADFASLARLHSEDGSYRTGGELGFKGKGEWVPEFANAAFALTEPGKVSKIVKTQFGYHIIQLIEKRGEKVNVRHILIRPKIDDNEYNHSLVRLDSLSDSIRAGYMDFETAILRYSDDADTRLSEGLMFNRTEMGITARYALSDMPSELARAVDTLQVGDISHSFIFTTQKHQTVCAIVKVKKRIPAHRASIEQDFELLSEILLNERREERLEEWVQGKIRTTYVRIDPEWQGCTYHFSGWGSSPK